MQKSPFKFLSHCFATWRETQLDSTQNGAKHFPVRERAQRHFQTSKVSKFEFIQQKFKR